MPAHFAASDAERQQAAAVAEERRQREFAQRRRATERRKRAARVAVERAEEAERRRWRNGAIIGADGRLVRVSRPWAAHQKKKRTDATTASGDGDAEKRVHDGRDAEARAVDYSSAAPA